MKKYFINIFVIVLTFISCNEKKNGFKISANLKGFPENSKVLIYDGGSQKKFDSTIITNGKFVLKGFLDNSPLLLDVSIYPSDGTSNSHTRIFIGNEQITLDGNKKNFRNGIQIAGSKYHKFKAILDSQIASLENKRSLRIQKMHALRQEGKWNDSLHSVYWSKNGIIPQLDTDILKKTKKFLSKNINSDFALAHLITTKDDYSEEFIKKQIKALKPQFAKTKYASVLKTYLETKPIKGGQAFYDFSAENINGKKIDFSSFFEDGKEFTLLEFTSPHCGWCKKALPELKALEKKYKDRLQIVNYNVESDKEDWLKTNESNKITWSSLWNKKGRYSDAFTKYRVGGTPTYYLFDKQGNVINGWLGYDENLFTSIIQEIE